MDQWRSNYECGKLGWDDRSFGYSRKEPPGYYEYTQRNPQWRETRHDESHSLKELLKQGIASLEKINESPSLEEMIKQSIASQEQIYTDFQDDQLEMQQLLRDQQASSENYKKNVETIIRILSETQQGGQTPTTPTQIGEEVNVTPPSHTVITEKIIDLQEIEEEEEFDSDFEKGVGAYVYRNCEESTEDEDETEPETTTRTYEEPDTFFFSDDESDIELVAIPKKLEEDRDLDFEEDLKACFHHEWDDIEDEVTIQEHEEEIDAFFSMEEIELLGMIETKTQPEVTTRDYEEIEEEIESFLFMEEGGTILTTESEEEIEAFLNANIENEATTREINEQGDVNETKSSTVTSSPVISSTITSLAVTTSPRILNSNEEKLRKILDDDPFWIHSAPISNSSRVITSSHFSPITKSSPITASPPTISSPQSLNERLLKILEVDKFWVNSVLVNPKCGKIRMMNTYLEEPLPEHLENIFAQRKSSSPTTPLSHSLNENLFKVLKADPFSISSIIIDPKCGKNMFITEGEYVFDPGGRIRKLEDLSQSAKKIVRADDSSWRVHKEPEVTRPP